MHLPTTLKIVALQKKIWTHPYETIIDAIVVNPRYARGYPTWYLRTWYLRKLTEKSFHILGYNASLLRKTTLNAEWALPSN
jgi:hypothetical protein